MKENNLNSIIGYLLEKPGAVLDFPFGADTPVTKVGGKMFALAGSMNGALGISLKCEPLLAEELRKQHDAVLPGYYLNKRHWNTIRLNGSLSDEEIMRFGDLSYELVLKTLTKSEREKALNSATRSGGPGPEWSSAVFD